MIASALLLVGFKPRVVLKPTRGPVSHSPHPRGKPTEMAVWVDGRDTGVRVPQAEPGLSAIQERSNDRGDLGGEFSEEYRGAMNGTDHCLFVKTRGGKFTFLPPSKGNNPRFVDIGAKGEILGVDDPNGTQLSEVVHAHLWSESKWIDLGPAGSAHFDRDGSVVGSFPADRWSRPLEPIDYGGEGFRVRFLWKDGKRTESKPYQA